ncbi:hypothetical protein COCON_G00058160 [Conger conger]|uniref:Uncharacterized protein n=1 Tax=Conger conger TaxID=82655 RepID=A0A9Q1I377_CONCO|nr:hypothetical protein COCON_G00058160 [Conger conger]
MAGNLRRQPGLNKQETDKFPQSELRAPGTSSDFGFSRKGQLIFSASQPSSRPASSTLGPGSGSLVSNGTGFSSVSIFSSEQQQRWIQATAKVGAVELHAVNN